MWEDTGSLWTEAAEKLLEDQIIKDLGLESRLEKPINSYDYYCYENSPYQLTERAIKFLEEE